MAPSCHVLYESCYDTVLTHWPSLSYKPADYYEKIPELKQALDMIKSGFFSPEDSNLFVDIFNSLVYDDRQVKNLISFYKVIL